MGSWTLSLRALVLREKKEKEKNAWSQVRKATDSSCRNSSQFKTEIWVSEKLFRGPRRKKNESEGITT